MDRKTVGDRLSNARDLAARGEIAAAEKAYRELTRLAPAEPAVWMEFGSLAMRQGLTQEAEGAFRQVLAINPGSAAAWSSLGVTLLHRGQFAEAEEHARRAVELDGANGAT